METAPTAPGSSCQQWRRGLAWAGLLLASATLHLAVLGRRTLHHDEAVHAWFSDRLVTHRIYQYDPTYHGPLLYFATAGVMVALPPSLVGDRELVCRLPIALAGVAMVGVAWAGRRVLGHQAAWWTGLLFTVSPVFLFFGRFLRMDILEVLTASCALLAWCAVLRGAPRAWMALGVSAGCAIATKENAYVTLCLVGAVTVLLGLVRGPRRSLASGVGWLRRRWSELAFAGLALLLVTIPLYTAFFSHPEDVFFPGKAIRFWWLQHLEQRVGGPWWYYLPRLVQYEALVLVAATVRVVRRWRRLCDVELFLLLFGVGSVLMYGYLGEKVPWLLVHQVWPFVPLAGAELAACFGPGGRLWSRVLAVAGLSLTGVATLVCCFVLDEISPAKQRVESLHYVQTCPEMQAVICEGRQLGGDGDTGGIFVTGEAAWPLHWYWRDLDVHWSEPPEGSSPALVVCNPQDAERIGNGLASPYERRRVPLRAWWLMYEHRPTVVGALRYLVARVPWGRVGSTDVMVLSRSNEEDSGEVRYRSLGEAVELQFPRHEPGEAATCRQATVPGN